MSRFDLILIRTTKVVGLVLGTFIMAYETLADHQDRPYLYAAALLMMGLQVAEIVERLAVGFGATKTGASLEQAKTQIGPRPPSGPGPPSKP